MQYFGEGVYARKYAQIFYLIKFEFHVWLGVRDNFFQKRITSLRAQKKKEIRKLSRIYGRM